MTTLEVDLKLLQKQSRLYLIKVATSSEVNALLSGLKINLLQLFNSWYKHLAVVAKDSGFIDVAIEQYKRNAVSVNAGKENDILNRIVSMNMVDYADKILDENDPNDLISILVKYNKKAFELGAKQAAKAIGFEVDFKLNDSLIELLIENRIEKLSRLMLSNTLTDVNNIVKSCLLDGVVIEADILKAISDATNEKIIRAKRISKTEIQHARIFGIFSQFKHCGLIKKRWVTINPTVREKHKINSKQNWIYILQPFSNGEMYPGDSIESIGCDCVLEGMIENIDNIKIWNGQSADLIEIN